MSPSNLNPDPLVTKQTRVIYIFELLKFDFKPGI